MVGLDDVREAAARLDGVAHRTPVFQSRTIDAAVGAHVLLKAEVLQRAGSFKFRGAFNAIASLPESERHRGVVAVSSGNHAQAVALAGSLLGAPATIVMPIDAPDLKLAATRAYGAQVVFYERYSEDREEIARGLAEDRGLTLVHPFDDPRVVAGQGTAALELLDEAGPIDLLVAPVGGGGLIAGCASVVRSIRPEAKVVGVEPETGDDLKQSLAAGRRVTIEVPHTIADALQVTSPGKLTFPLLRELVDEVVTVSDPQLADAMRFCFERLKLVVEPAGAAGIAALLGGRVTVQAGSRIGVILSGGNIDSARFCTLLADSRLRARGS